MLLVHQSGSVKVGEVVRYTLTYTPANDRILPTPSHLHIRIKNTSAIPLRAAYLHGPYALHVSAYPATFNPHQKVENPERNGTPDFEPMLKAGGSWTSKLTIPDDIRETGADLGKRRQSHGGEGAGAVTWIIEVASQILFSNSASVGFEVLVGRDARSLDLGFAAVASHGHAAPGQVKDFYESAPGQRGIDRTRRRSHQTVGVYSKAVRLQVEDTEALWDKPSMPDWEYKDADGSAKKRKRRKKVHLVVLTHGLHSNIGADMLFLKESIDATVAQARADKAKRKKSGRQGDPSDETASNNGEESATAPLSGGQEDLDSDEEEETIVRGFTGNAVRTENGIQYLGKRLAKYIFKLTYPDQPFLPVKKKLTQQLTDPFRSAEQRAKDDQAEGLPAHEHSSIHHPAGHDPDKLPYKFTRISFVGHSLGGLIQMYAIAYIQKHSPGFFKQIEPVNFICMASPLLGLSNENPMYVKFALDFGLVGRTGQDLGLTWRPPAMVRGGWNAMIGGIGSQKETQEKQQNGDPGAKPLLRILPTGPAHQVLRLFRNRTVYSNVVNDGIVPLRTSCLLFLDWRGLGKVEKARRENGLIGTMAEWGWAELTGANERERNNSKATIQDSGRVHELATETSQDDSDDEYVRRGEGETVPLPAEDETTEDNRRETNRLCDSQDGDNDDGTEDSDHTESHQEKGMWDNFLDFFRTSPERTKTPPHASKKSTKAIRRAQTLSPGEDESSEETARTRSRSGTTSNPTMRPHLPHLPTGQVQRKKPTATRGDSIANAESLEAPPKTSIFESAGDILHPPIPSTKWLTDPSSRARTIFHDRVYHPEDIPPPPLKRPGSKLTRAFSSDGNFKISMGSQESQSSASSQETVDSSGMKVEEKIARAYHRDVSWRKVLVRLEPDAHNNMIVRRIFANAYGWPVVKHLCDTHFADTWAAQTRDEDEPARERAKPMDLPVSEQGEHVEGQTDKQPMRARTESELREARDELADLNVTHEGVGSISSSRSKSLSRPGSALWDDAIFESDAGDSDVDERGFLQRMMHPMPKDPDSPPKVRAPVPSLQGPSGTLNDSSPATPTMANVEYHRGIGPRSPTTPKTPKSIRPTHDASEVSPVVATKLVQEPQEMEPADEPASASTTRAVGLGKSVEEQVSPLRKKGQGNDEQGGSMKDVVSSLSISQD